MNFIKRFIAGIVGIFLIMLLTTGFIMLSSGTPAPMFLDVLGSVVMVGGVAVIVVSVFLGAIFFINYAWEG